MFIMPDKKIFFNNPALGKKSLVEVVEEIVAFINCDSQSFYHLIIGTDSQDHALEKVNGYLNLVSAIVIYRDGHGGRYFWRRQRLPHSRNLREKIYQETLTSLDLAQKLVPLLHQKLNGNEYELEIHIDVGNAGPTREMIRELVAMVNSNGFRAKTKPESYGATCVADKYT